MKILAIPASLRSASFNRKLLLQASAIARSESAEVESLDLKQYSIPNYDGDIQDNAGFPADIQRLHQRLTAHRVLMISSPEYNFSMPGHFKNTFDWISRIKPMPWSGKIVLLMSASPSNVGGNRGLWSLRVPFEACGAIVYPEMFSLFQADQAFDDSGNFKDGKNTERLGKVVRSFLAFATKIEKE